MAVPNRDECIRLMRRARMPEHIQKHSFLVADVALFLSGHLNSHDIRLSMDVVQAGALLHDIAKAQSLATGERHETLGARMLHQAGYLLLSSMVQDHVSMDLIRLHGPITESILVNYADKRVKHDQVVTLKERFADLVQRYSKTKQQQAHLDKKYRIYLELEQKIFRHLKIEPNAGELMQLSASNEGEENGGEEQHGRWQTTGGIACRGEIR
jgi:uncharacterized protein